MVSATTIPSRNISKPTTVQIASTTTANSGSETWGSGSTRVCSGCWRTGFEIAKRSGSVTGSTEQRVQVSNSRVRIPDLVVLRPGPQPDILVDPPLLVIEILSPDDTYSDTQERAQDYLNMGVPALWIIDPKTRTGPMCSGTGWIAADRLGVAGTDLYVDLAAIFNGIGDRP